MSAPVLSWLFFVKGKGARPAQPHHPEGRYRTLTEPNSPVVPRTKQHWSTSPEKSPNPGLQCLHIQPQARKNLQGSSPTPLRLVATGPTHSTLRANPFPEVTDLLCRLPLPTLFYQLEAVNLGDLMRLSVRPWVRINLSPGFSRAIASAPDTSRRKVLYQPVSPYLQAN